MSSNIEYAYIPGRTLYAVDELNGQFWNTQSSAREAFNSLNWAHYAIPLSEYTGTGIYFAVYPAAIPTGQLATQIIYQQNGSSPVIPGTPGGDSFLSMGQSQGANLQTIGGNGAAAVNLALSAGTILAGAAVSGTLSTTQMTTNLPATVDSTYVGRVVIWTSGALLNQASNITAYLGSSRRLTFAAKTSAPAIGDTFVIV